MKTSGIFPLSAAALTLVLLLSLFLALCPGYCSESSGHGKIAPVFATLAKRLIQDGQDPEFIMSLFQRPEVRFDSRVMPRKLTHKEALLDYSRFLKPERISRAQRYLEENGKLLSRIQAEYGVPKEIKVAILLVETDLGKYLGSGRAFNILASMAAATNLDAVKPWLPSNYITPENVEAVEKKLLEKSRWAYQELKALLIYCAKNQMDPVAIKGSIFGAIGICQFMPSNAIKYGVDFDHDGRINLFQKADALASMANYLKAHGWKDDLDKDGRIKILLSYNYSRPYANTILKVADRLARR